MKRFRLTSRIGTLTIFAWSKKTAEESAAFDYLMGLGPIFEVVTVEQAEKVGGSIPSARISNKKRGA